MPASGRPRPVALRDGTTVLLRLMTPDDRQLLVEGFERLGERSRYRRFFGPMAQLPPALLDRLTDVGHRDHEAVVALDPDTGDLVGVARFQRSPAGDDVADVSITVADDWQGRGLGRILLEQLTARARQRGIHRYTASVLAENRAVMALLSGLGELHLGPPGPEVELTIDLPPGEGLGTALRDALRAAASGRLVATARFAERHGFLRPPSGRPAADRPLKVLVVGTDGTRTARRAVDAALGLAAAVGGAVHLVSAHRSARGAPRAERTLAAAAAAARRLDLEPALHARHGDPAAALIAVAEEVDADVIVVGSRRMTGAARYVAGSVGDRVSHHAPCSVLIVRTDDDDPAGAT